MSNNRGELAEQLHTPPSAHHARRGNNGHELFVELRSRLFRCVGVEELFLGLKNLENGCVKFRLVDRQSAELRPAGTGLSLAERYLIGFSLFKNLPSIRARHLVLTKN